MSYTLSRWTICVDNTRYPFPVFECLHVSAGCTFGRTVPARRDCAHILLAGHATVRVLEMTHICLVSHSFSEYSSTLASTARAYHTGFLRKTTSPGIRVHALFQPRSLVHMLT